MMKWMLIRKARNKVEKARAVYLTSATEKYLLLTDLDSQRESIEILMSVVQFTQRASQKMRNHVINTPRQWVRGYHIIKGAWDDLDVKIPMLSEDASKGKVGYTLAWSIRGWLYSMMRRQGRQQLQRVSDVSVDEFMATFPDQKSMWPRFLGTRRRQRPLSLKEFFREADYHGPWELCTMVWCFIGHPNFNKVTAEWLEEHVEELHARREALKVEEGQNPHPAVLVHDCAIDFQ